MSCHASQQSHKDVPARLGCLLDIAKESQKSQEFGSCHHIPIHQGRIRDYIPSNPTRRDPCPRPQLYIQPQAQAISQQCAPCGVLIWSLETS